MQKYLTLKVKNKTENALGEQFVEFEQSGGVVKTTEVDWLEGEDVTLTVTHVSPRIWDMYLDEVLPGVAKPESVGYSVTAEEFDSKIWVPDHLMILE